MLDHATLRTALAQDEFWASYLAKVESNGVGVHLAVLVEPYLHDVLEGRKTVESRFGVKRIPPFDAVWAGDIILLKASAGPVVGICRVDRVWYYRMSRSSWREIRAYFGSALCLRDEDEFVQSRASAAFATLLKLGNVRGVPPIATRKRDRRGWVVLRSRDEMPSLPGLEFAL